METNFSTEINSNSTNIIANDSKSITSEALPDKDDFLRLLITQLQHQNPLKPLDNQDFIAQLAQFNVLDELKRLNEQMSILVELQMTQKDKQTQ